MAFNWTCPYCHRAQSVTSSNYSNNRFAFQTVETAMGHIGLIGSSIVCANPECRQVSISAHICEAWLAVNGVKHVSDDATIHLTKRILPNSAAKPQPEFIPAALREDYEEACLILELSPKAAATLARRCLQGMIRDFCGITKGTLFKEIAALKDLIDEGNAPIGVSGDSVDAIDHIRQIGNIGAHMEKDINVIIDVDPDEAKVLVDLIESLFEEWYVERQKRQDRFARLKAIAIDKAEQKQITKE